MKEENSFDRRSRQSGFTLLESLIGLSISVVVVAGVISVFIMIQRTMAETAQLNQINNAARNFSDWIARDLRMASGLVSAEEIFPGMENALVMTVPPIDVDEYVVENFTQWDLIAYYPRTVNNARVMVRQIIPGPDSSRTAERITFGKELSGNSFAGTFASKPDVFGAFVVHYQFTDSRTVRGETLETHVSGSVRLRNKEQSVGSGV